jgi:DNA-binding transcriptional MerR regulator
VPDMRSVGELARATGVTIRALHHYEEIGLLAPSARTASGHRRYSDEDMQRLYRIVALRGLGLSLADVADVLARDGDLGSAVDEHVRGIDAQVAALARVRRRLVGIRDALDRGEAQRAAGTDPADPRVHQLAERWRELVEQFTGGDPGIASSLRSYYDDNPNARGMSPELMAYVRRAWEAQAPR